jgi:hypothetical protein
VEHALELQATDFGLQPLGVVVDVARGRFVALAFRELQELGGIRNPLGRPLDFARIGL